MLETDIAIRPNIETRNARRQATLTPSSVSVQKTAETSEMPRKRYQTFADIPQSQIPSIPNPPPPPPAVIHPTEASAAGTAFFDEPDAFFDEPDDEKFDNLDQPDQVEEAAMPDQVGTTVAKIGKPYFSDNSDDDPESAARRERLFGHIKNQEAPIVPDPNLWDKFCDFWDLGKVAIILITSVLFLISMVFFNQARINDKHTDAIKYVNDIYDRLNEDDQRIVKELGSKIIEVESAGKNAEERWKTRALTNADKLDHLNATVLSLMQMYNDERTEMKEFRIALMRAMGATEDEAKSCDLLGGLSSMLADLGRMSKIRRRTEDIQEGTEEIKDAKIVADKGLTDTTRHYEGDSEELRDQRSEVTESFTSGNLSSNGSVESEQNWRLDTPPPGRVWIWVGEDQVEGSKSGEKWQIIKGESGEECQPCRDDSSSNHGVDGNSSRLFSSSSQSASGSLDGSEGSDHAHRISLTKILTAPFRWIGGLF